MHWQVFLAYNKTMKKTNKIPVIILSVIGAACLITAGVFLIRNILSGRHAEAKLEAMRASAELLSGEALPSGPLPETASVSDASEEDVSSETVSTENAQAPEDLANGGTASGNPVVRVENPYRDSFLANEDMAAWIRIPDTKIDYPVMWTPRDENYYLYKDFEGKKDQNGCLILDTDSSLDPLSTNLIIHGHNMRSGAMFGDLTDYEDEDYCASHREITLYTQECQRNYEVIAVFRSQVYKKTDSVFKFYKFFQADTQEEFDDFYQNIKELSLYDTGVTAEFGDHFLTLSTCVYHVEQGRFVVVAKEVESGDFYLPLQE